jgi:hypothetical protein
MTSATRRSAVGAIATLASAAVLAACAASASPNPSPAATALGPRPSSPAVVTIVEPARGAALSGTSVHVVLGLTGGRIVNVTSTDIRPDEGHIHLYVNNALVTMNYGLEQDVPVAPGTYVVKAEFVAADHAPFTPRVWSPEVYFTVR